MKSIIMTATMLMFLSACQQSGTSNNSNTDSATAAVAAKPAEPAIPFGNYRSLIKGTWVSADFIDDLAKTRSPHASMGKVRDIAALIIDTTMNDSIKITAVPNFHEGSMNIMAYLRKGNIDTNAVQMTYDSYAEPMSKNYEIGYEVKGTDTLLAIYHYEKDKKLASTYRFYNSSKMKDPNTAYIVNKNLFTGTYSLASQQGQPATVTLNSDGTVTGLDDFKTYNADLEFVPNDADIITFYKNKDPKQSVSYGYKVTPDALLVYDTKTSGEYGDILTVTNRIKYKLVRQK
jgi:hypothetical protein